MTQKLSDEWNKIFVILWELVLFKENNNEALMTI